VQLLDEFGAAVNTELRIKIAAVIDRRALADAKPFGDLRARPPYRQQLADFELAAG